MDSASPLLPESQCSSASPQGLGQVSGPKAVQGGWNTPGQNAASQLRMRWTQICSFLEDEGPEQRYGFREQDPGAPIRQPPRPKAAAT